MTDLYPDEEGLILDGFSIGFCYAGGTIALNQQVQDFATGLAGYVGVAAGAVPGDSFGIAMKAAATNDILPVLFYGVAKLMAEEPIVDGDYVISSTTAGYVEPVDTYTAGQLVAYKSLNYTGTIRVFGLALQAATATGDELLVLVGHGGG